MEYLEEERIFKQMSKQESDAFFVLLKKANNGLIQTSKESLLMYFDKMHKKGWKNIKGQSIYNIVGYVTSTFNIYSNQQMYVEEKLAETGLPVRYEGRTFRNRY